MRKHCLPALSLACVLVLSGCLRRGDARLNQQPVCPQLQPIPAQLLQRTDYASKVQAELLDTSDSSKPSATKP